MAKLVRWISTILANSHSASYSSGSWESHGVCRVRSSVGGTNEGVDPGIGEWPTVIRAANLQRCKIRAHTTGSDTVRTTWWREKVGIFLVPGGLYGRVQSEAATMTAMIIQRSAKYTPRGCGVKQFTKYLDVIVCVVDLPYKFGGRRVS